MKEPLGPVDDPVLDPAISQETLSKKVRVGLEYLARVAREWPETASKGENVDEKRRFERRRRRGERRRSTLILGSSSCQPRLTHWQQLTANKCSVIFSPRETVN